MYDYYKYMDESREYLYKLFGEDCFIYNGEEINGQNFERVIPKITDGKMLDFLSYFIDYLPNAEVFHGASDDANRPEGKKLAYQYFGLILSNPCALDKSLQQFVALGRIDLGKITLYSLDSKNYDQYYFDFYERLKLAKAIVENPNASLKTLFMVAKETELVLKLSVYDNDRWNKLSDEMCCNKSLLYYLSVGLKNNSISIFQLLEGILLRIDTKEEAKQFFEVKNANFHLQLIQKFNFTLEEVQKIYFDLLCYKYGYEEFLRVNGLYNLNMNEELQKYGVDEDMKKRIIVCGSYPGGVDILEQEVSEELVLLFAKDPQKAYFYMKRGNISLDALVYCCYNSLSFLRKIKEGLGDNKVEILCKKLLYLVEKAEQLSEQSLIKIVQMYFGSRWLKNNRCFNEFSADIFGREPFTKDIIIKAILSAEGIVRNSTVLKELFDYLSDDELKAIALENYSCASSIITYYHDGLREERSMVKKLNKN